MPRLLPHDIVFFASPAELRSWRQETRARRLAALVAGCAAGERLAEITGKPTASRAGTRGTA